MVPYYPIILAYGSVKFILEGYGGFIVIGMSLARLVEITVDSSSVRIVFICADGASAYSIGYDDAPTAVFTTSLELTGLVIVVSYPTDPTLQRFGCITSTSSFVYLVSVCSDIVISTFLVCFVWGSCDI